MYYVKRPDFHVSQTVCKCWTILYLNVLIEHAFLRLLGSAFQLDDPEYEKLISLRSVFVLGRTEIQFLEFGSHSVPVWSSCLK